MKSNKKIIFSISVAVLLSLVFLNLLFNRLFSAIFLLLICDILMITYEIRLKNGKVTVFTIFLIFYTLYSLSGPVSLGIFGEINSSFTPPFHFKTYVLLNGLITYILCIFIVLNNNRIILNIKTLTFSKVEIYSTLLLASVFEVINIFRIGGFKTLLIGKSQYQSLLSNTRFILPSFYIFVFGYIMFLLMVHRNRKPFTISNYLYPLLISLPVISTQIVAGARGPLVQLALISIVIHTFFKPLVFKWKNLSLALMCVSIFTLFFSYDGRAALSKSINDRDFSTYLGVVVSKENFENSFNLGKNEFGFTYGNYNEFYKKYGNNHIRENTILEGVLVAIPGFLLPIEKPEQIVYRFRDEFFPNRALYGRVSSTGFSALLEGHINSGYFGSVIYYASLAVLFLLLNILLKKNKFMILFYFSSIIAAQRIHRISFGDLLGIFVLQLISLTVVISFVKFNQELRKSYGKRGL